MIPHFTVDQFPAKIEIARASFQTKGNINAILLCINFIRFLPNDLPNDLPRSGN